MTAQGARLTSAVMFVRDLDRSVSFYQDVLAVQVADRSPTAALLVSAGGDHLVLRAMGPGAAQALGSIGVQYVVWAAASREDLDRGERALRARSAYRETRDSEGVIAVEGTDPDGLVVMISYTDPGREPLRKLPARIYAW